ncbi:MAG: redoxin domain-containing protein [Bacteroidales bacterium]|nr:redoxin domain-containing protein [Bacteroidales bacterium]
MNTFKTILLIFSFLLATAWLTPGSVRAQASIEGSISGYRNKNLRLLLIRGDKKILVDSTKTDAGGYFMLLPLTAWPAGMYMLQTEDGNSIRLLVNGTEKIQFVSDGQQSDHIVDFTLSEENRNWYAYSLLKSETLYKLDLLKPILREFPQNDTFYIQTREAFDRLQHLPYQKGEALIAEKPGSLAARFIEADLPPLIDLSLDFEAQRQQLKAHFFDRIDFTDTDLIHSDILTTKMIDFLALYQRPNMSIEEVQLEFIKALNLIFQQASVSNEVYVFALEYFIEGFYRMGLTAVSDFLSSLPHLNPDCMEPDMVQEIERIAGPYRKIADGVKAPDILTTDIQGDPFDLSKVSKPHTILVFWSVTCPYCLELIPELYSYSKKHPDIEVVSVLISPDSPELRELVAKEAPDWIHLIDQHTGSTPISDEYMIYATPSLFLLDAHKHVIAKPFGIADLEAYDLP